jgi:hypothetical protein
MRATPGVPATPDVLAKHRISAVADHVLSTTVVPCLRRLCFCIDSRSHHVRSAERREGSEGARSGEGPFAASRANRAQNRSHERRTLAERSDRPPRQRSLAAARSCRVRASRALGVSTPSLPSRSGQPTTPRIHASPPRPPPRRPHASRGHALRLRGLARSLASRALASRARAPRSLASLALAACAGRRRLAARPRRPRSAPEAPPAPPKSTHPTPATPPQPPLPRPNPREILAPTRRPTISRGRRF